MPPGNRLHERADDAVGPHRIVRCLAVTSTCEIDHAVTFGPFGFERDVVLKRILAGLDPDEAIRAGGRLLREAAALARLSHPAIVRLYELTEHAGAPVLVLEHVDGLSLAQLLDAFDANGAPLDDACALYIGYRVFCALGAAHRACDPLTGAPAPVVHGDVAPSNVLVPWDGHVKLADFDLSSGHGLGTPGFTAPERMRGGAASTRSDVFSACALLRELLVRAGGAAPTDASLSEARPGLHPGLTDMIEHGLSPDHRARTVTAAEIAARLRDVVDVELARERLVRHTSAFVRRISVRERGAVRAPAPSAEARARDEIPVDVDLGGDVPGQRESPEALSSFRPTAMSVPPSLSSLRTVKTARRRRQQAARVLAGIAGVGVAVACALFVLHALRGRELLAGARAPAALPSASAVAPAIAVPVAASAEPPRDPSLGADAPVSGAAAGDAAATGRILTEPGEHRVFVDGKSVGHEGTPVVVACGRRLVRIGSTGPSRVIDVPCGGDVNVGR